MESGLQSCGTISHPLGSKTKTAVGLKGVAQGQSPQKTCLQSSLLPELPEVYPIRVGKGVCVCVHMCVHVHMCGSHVCTCMCVHVCVFICVYMCVHMPVCMHVCTKPGKVSGKPGPVFQLEDLPPPRATATVLQPPSISFHGKVSPSL